MYDEDEEIFLPPEIPRPFRWRVFGSALAGFLAASASAASGAFAEIAEAVASSAQYSYQRADFHEQAVREIETLVNHQ